MSRSRPDRRHELPSGPPIAIVAGVVALFAATRSSLTPVPVVIAVLLSVVDVAWGRWTLRRTVITATPHVEVVPATHDAPLGCRVTGGPRSVSLLAPGGGPAVDLARSGGELVLPPGEIGAHRLLVLDARAALFGFVPVIGPVVIELTQPLHRGPTVGGRTDATVPAPGAAGDQVGTREYVPGDRPGRVDWAATARTGILMVRAAAEEDELVSIVVDLGPTRPPDSWLDDVASRIAVHLDRGEDVRLVTHELSDGEWSTSGAGWAPDDWAPAGRVVDALLTGRTDVLRRLARVVPGPRPPVGAGDVVWSAAEAATAVVTEAPT